MAVSMRDVDSAFQGAGQKAGMEIWRIENFLPVPVPKCSYGKFFMGDSYVILKTTKSFHHDIHYWLGKDTSQDEAGTAAIKTVELDAALGGRAVQYREVQGHETEKFLSYFKPCIIPQQGGGASGFKHIEINGREHETRLYVCNGKHVVRVKEGLKHKFYAVNPKLTLLFKRGLKLLKLSNILKTHHEGQCEVAVVVESITRLQH